MAERYVHQLSWQEAHAFKEPTVLEGRIKYFRALPPQQSLEIVQEAILHGTDVLVILFMLYNRRYPPRLIARAVGHVMAGHYRSHEIRDKNSVWREETWLLPFSGQQSLSAEAYHEFVSLLTPLIKKEYPNVEDIVIDFPPQANTKNGS
ncbi:hypothetical protein HYV81_04095 [Candidatus Woesearchaeota archaeon]|nr:hypothetical protein [Candidatus Woesearchaeota archaeon]